MGQPKAWLPFGDELLLQRVVRIVGSVVAPVVVVAAPGQKVPELPGGVEIVRDEVEGRGPLAGLAAGLRAINEKVDAVYLSACDVPFLSPAFIQRVVSRIDSHAIAVPRVGGYLHPLAAVYRVHVIDTVVSLLAVDRLRPVFLYDRLPTKYLDETDLIDVDPGFQSLRNVNELAEYEAALRELSPRSPTGRGE